MKSLCYWMTKEYATFWVAVGAISGAIVAVVTVANFLFPRVPLEVPSITTEESTDPLTPTSPPRNYTNWKSKPPIRFEKTPTIIEICNGVEAKIEIGLPDYKLLVNGESIPCDETRPLEIGASCRVLCYKLDSERNYRSGGQIMVEYREKR